MCRRLNFDANSLLTCNSGSAIYNISYNNIFIHRPDRAGLAWLGA